MLFEHEEGRKFVREMKKTLEKEKGNIVTSEQIAVLASNYAEHLKSHIWKEENVLFKIANEAISEEKDEEIVQLFREYEEKEIGHGVHEHYIDIISRVSHTST